MVTVWVIYRDYDYEGYGEPVAAFSTEEQAKRAGEKWFGASHNWDMCEIELDPARPSLDKP